MKKWICYFLVLLMAAGTLQGSTMHAEAAGNTGMKIYDIYLGDRQTGGDATLIESNGNFLLMDMGFYEQTRDYVIPLLKKLGVKKLSIYFSHMHIDHYGGKESNITAGLDAIASISGMTIENLYLPDSSIGKADSSYIKKYQRFIDTYNGYTNKSGKVVRLKLGSVFQLGTATAKVLGPLGTNQSQASLGGQNYQNNMSLVTMITCGSTRFLTAGDTMSEQEKLLVNKYKGTSELNADIMKLSHHGTPEANSDAFMELVSPTYAYAQNSGYSGKLSGTKYNWRVTYNAWNTVNKYGMSYMTANEKKNLVYVVENGKVTMYRDCISAANKLSGLVTLYGRSGLRNDTNVTYYIDSNGRPYKGLKKLKGKTYYFDYCKVRGKYSADTQNWNPLYAVRGTYRYYDTITGEMAIGFKVTSGKKYYYDKDGLRLLGTSKWKLQKIEGNWYALNQTGAIAVKSWKKFAKGYRYFDESGKMLIGGQKIGKYKYYFDSSGYRTDNKIKKIGKYKYYFNTSGKLITGQMYNVGRYRYSFDKNGRMAINKVVAYKGQNYYFDKNGRMVKSKIVTIKREKYYFNGGGKMVKSSLQKIGKYTYYFDKSGKMVKNKKVTINGRKYTFDKNGRMKN